MQYAWGVLEAWTNLDFVSHTREKQFYTLCNRSLSATCCRESDRRAEKCSTCEGSRHEFCALREEGKLFLEIGILRATRRVTSSCKVNNFYSLPFLVFTFITLNFHPF